MSKSKPTLNKLDEEAIWNGIKQFARDPRGVTNYLKKDTLGRIGRTISDKVKGAFEPASKVNAALNAKTFYDSSKGGEKGIIDVRNPKFFALIKKYFSVGEELGNRFLQDVQAGKLASSRVSLALNSIQSFFDFLKSRDSSNYQNIVSQWTMRDDANEFMRDPSIGIPINVRPRVLNELNLAFARAMRGGANKVMREAGENWGGEAVTGVDGQFERISDQINNFATELDDRIGKIKEQPLSEDELKEINSKIGQAKITLKRFIDLASKSKDTNSPATIKAAYEKFHKLEELEGELSKYMESSEERNKSLEEIENYVNDRALKAITELANYVQQKGAKLNEPSANIIKNKLTSIEEELNSCKGKISKYYADNPSVSPEIKSKLQEILKGIGTRQGEIEKLKENITSAENNFKVDSSAQEFSTRIANEIELPYKDLASKISNYKSTKNQEVRRNIIAAFGGLRNAVLKIAKEETGRANELGKDEYKRRVATLRKHFNSIEELKADFNAIEESNKINSIKNGLSVVDATIKTADDRLKRLASNGYNEEDANALNKFNDDAETELSNIEAVLGTLPDSSELKKQLIASVSSYKDRVGKLRQDLSRLTADGSQDTTLVNYIDRLKNAKAALDSLKTQIKSAVDRKSEDIDEYEDILKVFQLNKNRLSKAKEFLSKEYPDWDKGENKKAEELGNAILAAKQKIAEVEPLLKELYNIQFNLEVLERNYVELRNRLNKARSLDKLAAIRKDARNEMIRLLGLKNNLVKSKASEESKANIELIRKELTKLRKEAAEKMGPDYTKIKVDATYPVDLPKDVSKNVRNKKYTPTNHIKETFDDMISRLLQSARLLESAAPDALDSAINALDQTQPQADPTQPQQPQEPAIGDPVMNAEPPPEPTMDLQQDPQVEVSGLAPDADPRGVELDEPTHKSGEHSTRKVMSAVRKALETEVDQLAMNIARASKWPDKAAKKAIDITSDKSKRDILTKVKANLKGNMDKKLESILQECAILEKKMNKSKAKANSKAKKDTKKKADKKADKKPKKMKECVGSMSKYFESACVLDEAKAKDKKKKTGDSSKYIFGKSDKKKR